MRSLALVAALLAAPAFAGDMIARQGSDSVRLTEAPCLPAVLARIAPQVQADYRAAVAQLGGQTYTACWRRTGGMAHLVYEDGDQGMISWSSFKAALEI